MSDTLQLVVHSAHAQPNRNRATNVRYASSACRRSHHHSTKQEWLNKVRTTGKSWSEGFADLGLLSVGDVDDKLKHIGHSLRDFC
jgi:hypothetical protein